MIITFSILRRSTFEIHCYRSNILSCHPIPSNRSPSVTDSAPYMSAPIRRPDCSNHARLKRPIVPRLQAKCRLPFTVTKATQVTTRNHVMIENGFAAFHRRHECRLQSCRAPSSCDQFSRHFLWDWANFSCHFWQIILGQVSYALDDDGAGTSGSFSLYWVALFMTKVVSEGSNVQKCSWNCFAKVLLL